MDENYERGDGNIPTLLVSGNGIAEAWENSILAVHNSGLWYHREGKKDKGKLQVDTTMIIEIRNPGTAPFWHMGMTPTEKDLFSYQMEILGSTDLWVDPTDKTEKWEYTYSERLKQYPGENGPVNQLEEMVRKAIKTPSTRGLTATTWVPSRDYMNANPPCLQSFWFGLVPNEAAGDGSMTLNTNVRFRSRNPMIAAPMNQKGLVTLSYSIANQMNQGGLNVKVGRMVDMNDSYHVTSGNQGLLLNYIERYKRSTAKGETIKDRAMDNELAFQMLEEGKPGAIEKTLMQTRKTLEENLPADKVKDAFERERARVIAIAYEVSAINAQMYEESQAA